MNITIRYHDEPGPLKDNFRDPATGEWTDLEGYEDACREWENSGKLLGYFRAVLEHDGKMKVVESPRFPKDPQVMPKDLNIYRTREECYEDLFYVLRRISYPQIEQPCQIYQ